MLKRRLLFSHAKDTIDYNRDALQGINWLNGYCYNQKTGILEEKANQYASEKFPIQNCLHKLYHPGNNPYVGIYVWDKSGRFIRFSENKSGTLYFYPGENDYVFAVVFYDASGDSTNSVSLMPVDNRNTAKMFDVDFSSAEFSAGGARNVEINLSSIAGFSSYTDGMSRTNYPIIERGNPQHFGENVLPEECFVIQYWVDRTFLQNYAFGTDVEAAKSYFKDIAPLKVWI